MDCWFLTPEYSVASLTARQFRIPDLGFGESDAPAEPFPGLFWNSQVRLGRSLAASPSQLYKLDGHIESLPDCSDGGDVRLKSVFAEERVPVSWHESPGCPPIPTKG